MHYRLKKRILPIILNTLKQVIVPFLGLIFSWVITKKFSVELWGEITQITLCVSIIIHLVSWGNSEYLLKEFSAQPAKLKLFWQKCLTDRLPILFIACSGLAIYFANTIGIIVVSWCLIEYIYQSYEPIINFHKKFMITVWAEVAGALVLFLLLFVFRSNISLLLIVASLALADFFKTSIVVVYFSENLFPFKIQKPDFSYYTSAISFFLLGFVGLLYARTDLIYVTAYLSHREIAFYQIANTFFSFTKGGASMLILPFVPILYRLKKSQIRKLSFVFATIGIALSAVSLSIVYFILTKGYKFQVGFPSMFLGLLSIIPAFYTYTIVIFLFKENKQKRVVAYGVIGILLCLSFNALLVPSLGTVGAIASAAIAQWALIPLYMYEMHAVRKAYLNSQV